MKESLTVHNLQVSIEDKQILNGVTLTIAAGQVHALMGPNGSGKSTLAYAIMGHPAYKLKVKNEKCKIEIGKKNIIDLPTEERAKAGLFLAFQAPIGIPGVTVMNLLRSAYQSIHEDSSKRQTNHIQNPVLARRWTAGGMDLPSFIASVKHHAKNLRINESFLSRGIHDGFSGGEKKKLEILQALVLSPKFAIFDEIDTGLDVDALRIVADGVKVLAKNGTGVLIVTHYQRILRYLKPDRVHIMAQGRIVDSGDATLAQRIEKNGYGTYAS